MAGTRPGPAAKPDEVRQRRNPPASGPQTKVDKDAMPSYVDTNPEPPLPNEKWHSVARGIYDGLLTDPARMNMTSADWQLSMLVIENIHRDMMPQVVATVPASVDSETGIVLPADVIREPVAMNGARMANVLKWAAMINLTDAARRSVGLHIRLGVTTDDLNGPVEGVVLNRADLFLAPPAEEP